MKNQTVIHPLVDLLEGPEDYLLVADLPGVSKDALSLTVEGDKLSLSARVGEAQYRRTLTLGRAIVPEGIDAQLDAGVLKIRLPKAGAAKVKKIEIKAG